MFKNLFSNLDPQKNDKKTNDEKQSPANSFFPPSTLPFKTTEESKQTQQQKIEEEGFQKSKENPFSVDSQKIASNTTNFFGGSSNPIFNLQNLGINPNNNNNNNNRPTDNNQDEPSMFGLKPFYIPKPEENFPTANSKVNFF